jgi:hypothetical protein
MSTEISDTIATVTCTITGIALWAFLWIQMGGALKPPIA